MKLIPLSQNGGKNKGKYFAKVDDEDYDYLMQWKWSYSHGYASRQAKKWELFSAKHISMHRLIMMCMTSSEISDHIDMDRLNNQKYNLRKCTKLQNNVNRASAKNASSKYLGVSISRKNGRTYGWRARISISRKEIPLGLFANEEDAAKAYDNAAKNYYKEFANLNFKY